MLEDVGIGNNLLNRNLVVPQVRAKTKKKKKMDMHQNKNLLHNKGSHQTKKDSLQNGRESLLVIHPTRD
jgi:hypothetical protein